MNEEQKEILKHTRDRAAGCMYCGNSKAMQELVDMGFMKSVGFRPGVPDEYFTLTQDGKNALDVMDMDQKLKSLQGKAKMIRPKLTIEAIRGAVARGWCHKANENKVMDPELAESIVAEIASMLGVKE